MTVPVFRFSICSALMALSLVPAAVTAAEAAEQKFEYALSAGASYSDNTGRAGSNKQSSTSADAGLTAGIDYQRARSTLNLDADLTYRTRLSGNYGDDLAGGLAAGATYRFTPYFSWSAQDNLTQSLVIAQNAAAPGNTQTVNSFSTGPQLTMPLRPSTSLSISGRWTDVSYSKSNSDHRSLSGSLGVQQRLGDHSSMSLNGSTSHVSNNSLPSGSDYDTRSVYLGWSATGARTTLNTTAGHTSVDQGPGQSSGGATYSLGVTRRVATRSTLSLDAGRSLGDAADALGRDQVIVGISADGQPVFISVGPSKSDYATIGWALPADRSSLNLSASWRREDQQGASLDRDSFNADLNVTRRVSERFSLNFSSAFSRQHFDEGSVRFNEWSTNIGMNWALRPGFSTSVNWSRSVGDGDTALGAGTRDYTTNSVSVRLSWSPRP